MGTQNAEVTVYVRDQKKAQETLGNKVHYAIGDFQHLDAFEKAIKGQDRLLLISADQSVEPGLVELATKAKVKHIVKISVLGASSSAPRGSVDYMHGLAEETIFKIKGVPPVTVLRPT